MAYKISLSRATSQVCRLYRNDIVDYKGHGAMAALGK